MRKAFTLLELMVVVAIMAALATLSINGYRALTKGMQDRSALVAVQTLVDAARQRAEIDRKPALVFFYDELLTKADESKGTDLVGRGIAIAVRPIGRISAVDGNYFCDEFGDLDQIYAAENQLDGDSSESASGGTAMRLYRMADGSSVDVSPTVARRLVSATYILTGESSDDVADGSSDSGGKQIVCCAFKKVGGGSFAVGDVYGGEFASVTLPDGYYFGSSAPKSEGRFFVHKFDIDSAGNGARAVDVYAMKAGQTALDKIGSTVGGSD